MSQIDRGSETPVFEQIAAILAGRIEAGEYEPGRALPSISALCQEFGVAPLTMAKALRALGPRGLTRTVPRRGTFVIDRQPPVPKPGPGPEPLRSRVTRSHVLVFVLAVLLTVGAWRVFDGADVLIGGDQTPYSKAQLDAARCSAMTIPGPMWCCPHHHHGHRHPALVLADDPKAKVTG
jgi:DNA-binding transcriptional regulator YhcF (GntR family)